MRPEQQLSILLQSIKILKDLPVMKLAENKTLVQEIKSVINGKNLNRLMGDIHKDYLSARNEEKEPSKLTPESNEFLHSFARFKGATHDLFTHVKKKNGKALTGVNYTQPLTLAGATAFNSVSKSYTRSLTKDIKALKEAKEFEEVYNSIFSDHALQIGTAQDPTRIGSYIDYSPYIWNYQYYLSIPTLSQTIDRGIQIATRETPRIECEDEKFSEVILQVLKRSKFIEKLRKMLLFSHLSPRGSLIVPIADNDGSIRFNVLNDTQFTYSSGYQYTRLDFRDDGSEGVTQIFALGTLLRNGVTAHFLCPGFEPIFAIGKNRLFQLKGAAEAVNIYLYTIKVLCIRAQVIVQKWGGEGQNDTLLQEMKNLTADIDSRLSLNTSQKIPEGAELEILNNNLSEGFAKVSPIIKEFQGMLSGIAADYFYGSDTAYNANSFNIHMTHQNMRSEVQEGQIEPILRFVINHYLKSDKRFAKWKDLEDDFDIEFPSLYEPTDLEKAQIDEKRIANITTMAGYPELKDIFKDEGLLGKDYDLPEVAPSTKPPGEPNEPQV